MYRNPQADEGPKPWCRENEKVCSFMAATFFGPSECPRRSTCLGRRRKNERKKGNRKAGEQDHDGSDRGSQVGRRGFVSWYNSSCCLAQRRRKRRRKKKIDSGKEKNSTAARGSEGDKSTLKRQTILVSRHNWETQKHWSVRWLLRGHKHSVSRSNGRQERAL